MVRSMTRIDSSATCASLCSTTFEVNHAKRAMEKTAKTRAETRVTAKRLNTSLKKDFICKHPNKPFSDAKVEEKLCLNAKTKQVT